MENTKWTAMQQPNQDQINQSRRYSKKLQDIDATTTEESISITQTGTDTFTSDTEFIKPNAFDKIDTSKSNAKPIHEHYVEHHGTHPDWVDDNPGIPHGDEEDVRNRNNKCCRRDRGQDTKFRLQEIVLPKWIMIIARFNLIWEFVLYLMTVVTFALITYAAFFAFYEERLSTTMYAMDVIFSCDMLMRLVVEIWRYRNQVNVVIFTVPYSMFQFLLDLMSIIPLHQVYIWTVGTSRLSYLSNVDYWKFNRFIRMQRSYTFFTTLQEERRANERIMFLVRFTNLYLGFIHLVSCLLMYLVGVDPLDFLLKRNRKELDHTWMRVVNKKKFGFPTEQPWQIYVLATNFASATVTTVGYGDIAATNEVEMIWCIFFMLVGAIFLNGFYISQLTAFELELDGARFDLFYRVTEIMQYLKTVGTLPLFDAKVDEYYKFLWSYREGVYEVQFMQRLPPSFQEDLLFDICQEMFEKSFLFHGMNEALLRAIAKIVKVALYNPEMILCSKGDYANRMYYILQGECRILSKYLPKPAAILRAGSIIGEANLFFSYPYQSTVETRTCCQFMILEKEDLIIVLDDFRDQLSILRSRSQAKIIKLYETHQIYGIPPVCWVSAKTDYDNPSRPKPSSIRRTMRWGSGLNPEVIEDVVDDTKDLVIFDTPCGVKEIVKNHLTTYITCTVPEIMYSKFSWMPYWNGVIVGVSMIYAIIGPYCGSFGENSEIEESMCHFLSILNYPITILFIMDVFVEIIASVPVYGIYYQFWDGLKVRKGDIMFYVDILAALPLGFISTLEQSPSRVMDSVFKCLKLWKVNRYMRFLENCHTFRLFWIRLTRTILAMVYGIHFIGCISYVLACYNNPTGTGEICNNDSWINSYSKSFELTELKNAPRWMKMETLRDNAYLYSIFYSAATLTSAGFGDFSPQTITEMLWTIAFVLIGFYLIGYYTATLTSALACVVRPKLVFQQKLISVKQFMSDNHLSENLKDRIVEYFHLQNQLRGGLTLPRGVLHVMYDTPEYLRNDVLYLEVVDLLEGIPIFSKVESDVIIKISSFMKRVLIPANTIFIQRGEIRRVMYLIKHGSVGIFADDSDLEPMNLLEASSHFGVRDLLFGEPCHFTVKSVSNVCLYSIKLHQVQEAMAHDEEFWEFVEKERIRRSDATEEMVEIYSKLVPRNKKYREVINASESWVTLPDPPKPVREAKSSKGLLKERRAYMMNEEYEEPFRYFARLGKFLKLFLMRRAIHPVGRFASTWAGVMSVTSFTIFVCMCIETFVSYRRPHFRVLQWTFDIAMVVDIYVKMHWAYYTKRHGSAILISHPLKTCLNYVIHGTFVMDILACAPLEMIIPILGWTDVWGYGEGASWYTKLRWTRILHIKRIFVIFEITHTIFKHRNAVLLTLYVWTTLFACTFLGAICLFTSCPWEASFWTPGDEFRMPICIELLPHEQAPQYWATVKSGDAELMTSPWDRWILGVYYVSQVVLVIGFGDLISLRQTDVLILIFMQVFGFVFMRCVVADITAAEVDSDEIRTNFIESVSTLRLVMLRQNVPKRLMNTVMDHLLYTWGRSKGLQPRELFVDQLHPTLEADLYRELVGKQLANVALFRGFTSNLVRTLSSFLRKVYFRRGERIMRCGNLENELRIITTGKVFICDKNFNYLCTLVAGDCFGESSMMLKARNRYNAVAMTNVEIHYLSSFYFDLLMERYSNLKDLLEARLRGGDRDYFEIGLEEKMKLTKGMTIEQKQGLVESFKVRRYMVKTALSLRESIKNDEIHVVRWYRYLHKLVGYGTLDDNLPVLYFALGSHQKKQGRKFSLLVHPNCSLMNLFNSTMIWMSYITAAIATYETCFIQDDLGHVSRAVIKVSFWIEILYLVHMILKFFTPFEAIGGVFCKSHRTIIVSYLINPLGFFADIVPCIPVLVELFHQDLRTSTYHLVYLLKIIRLVKFYKVQIARKYDISMSTFRYKMTISVSSFCLMAHMLACFFYAISSCKALVDRSDLCSNQGFDTWTVVYKTDNGILDDPEDFRKWKWWIRSLYWVVTVVSTTGFGDIVPHSVPEMGVAIICFFCGAFILSVILSDFVVGMASLTKANREYMYQVQLLVKHLRNIGLSETRQNHVTMYFLMLWSRCRGTSYNKTTGILPICLQIDLCNALFGDCLKTIPYFRGHDEDSFIRQLSVRVIHAIYIPGICIVKEGDLGSSMFVVLKGLVTATKIPPFDPPEQEVDPNEEVILPKPGAGKKHVNVNLNVDLQQVYNVGDVFGRFPALFHEESYKKSYRAETRVEVLEIPQHVIHFLAIKFPYLRRNLMHVIQTRYDPNGPGESIFTLTKQKRDNDIPANKTFKTGQPSATQEAVTPSDQSKNTLMNPKPVPSFTSVPSMESASIRSNLSGSTLSAERQQPDGENGRRNRRLRKRQPLKPRARTNDTAITGDKDKDAEPPENTKDPKSKSSKAKKDTKPLEDPIIRKTET